MPNQPLNYQIWILAGGRLLLQTGTGFTLFYAPIFFVNQMGFSATSVGIALGSASVTGILGRFLGGSLCDSPQWGRKGTLLLSAAISAIADVFLALTYNYQMLVIGNLCMGFGVGLYWPSTEAAVADLTNLEQRNEAFAITRLADNIGLGLGVVFGGILINLSGNYRALFVIDAISFVVFYLIVHVAVVETYQFHAEHKSSGFDGWLKAFRDKRLWVFCLVNILFTTYMSQFYSTLPLYLTNFAKGKELGINYISGLFFLHIIFTALFQLPIVRLLNTFTRIQALMMSLLMWGISFIFVWITGNIANYSLISGILALLIGAIAMVIYNPSAAVFIIDISPKSLRGIYCAINSQCWAIGYLIGPPLGGWVLDKGDVYAHNFWLFAAASIILGLLILKYLQVLINKQLQISN